MYTPLVIAPAVLAALTPNYNNCNVDNAGDIINKDRQVLVETQEASIGTKCKVEEDSVEILRNLGYEILVDNDEGDLYYEVSDDQPMITKVAFSTPELNELRSRVNDVENYAIVYQALDVNINPFWMNNATLAYLRGFNKNYSQDSGIYSGIDRVLTCGSVNWNFHLLADTFLVDTRYYFWDYVNGDNYNSNYHPGEHPRGIDYKMKYFRDPITGSNIDLIHLFASIDGCYDYTYLRSVGEALLYTVSPVYSNFSEDLVSWAGDLQSAANKLYHNFNKFNFNLNKASFYNVMNADLNCSMADMLADMDAMNIAHKYLTGPGRLNDALGDYYGSTVSMNQRKSKFVEAVLNNPNENRSGTTKEKFESEVYDMLGLKRHNNTWINSNYYTDQHLVDSQSKYRILDKGGKPSLEVRNFIAKSFVNFVFPGC